MPFDLRLTDGDIVISPFDLQLNEVGKEAVAQRIAIQLNTFRGEYFLDTQFGTPYYQTILRKGVSLTLIDSELKKVIRGVTGVLQLISYSSSLDRASRTLSVRFKARVDDGIVDADLNLNEGSEFCVYMPPNGGNIVYIRTAQPLLTFPIGGANMDQSC
jgi:hypothetical protein